MKKKYIAFVMACLAFFSNTYAQSPAVLQKGDPAAAKFSPERLARIDQLIRRYIDSGWIKGAIGFIARDGHIVYNKAQGINDAATNSPLQTDAIYRIASQTKAITSTAVMILFEEGKLLLDDPVSRYIPAFAHPRVLDQFNEKDSSYTTIPAKREITIRDLLTHTSGIDYAILGSPKMRAIYAKADIPSGIGTSGYKLSTSIPRLGSLPLAHQPGERFTYSLSIDVLGYLVEVVSGMSLDEFFHKRIFEPLGMNDTYFYLPAAKYKRLVALYTEDSLHHLKQVTATDPQGGGVVSYALQKGSYFSGGAGLVSTIGDYAIFLQMMLNGGVYNGHRILARRTVELMTMNQIGSLQEGLNKFGLGFEINTERGMAELGLSQGAFSWGGYFGTIYWADPQKHLLGLLYIQQVPLSHNDIHNKFKALVYQALAD